MNKEQKNNFEQQEKQISQATVYFLNKIPSITPEEAQLFVDIRAYYLNKLDRIESNNKINVEEEPENIDSNINSTEDEENESFNQAFNDSEEVAENIELDPKDSIKIKDISDINREKYIKDSERITEPKNNNNNIISHSVNDFEEDPFSKAKELIKKKR